MERWLILVLLLAFPAVATAEPADGAPEATSKQDADTPQGRLPWETTRQPPKLPGRKFQGAKEFLELLGVDVSQWRNLLHDQPLGPADEEWIDRILYHLPRIGGENLHRWRKADWTFPQVAADPAKYQGDVLHLRGWAKQVEKVDLLPELVDRYEFSHYWRVQIALDEQHTAIVCARSVPQAWAETTSLDERARVDGIFLKTSPVESGPSELVFASQRVAWLPDKPDVQRQITPGTVLLAEHGFDFGLWDQVRGRKMSGLTDADRVPFYQLLAVMREIKPSLPPMHSAPPVDIPLSIQSPDQQLGSFVTVDGAVRRIDRVEVNDSEIRTRFGIDHYYTLYVFVPLHNQRIKWTRHRDDPNPRLFENQFPVTVCLPSLPPGLSAGPNVNEHVRIHGTYFKTWIYTPQGGGQDLPQPSPLILASSAVLVPAQGRMDGWTNLLLGVVFAALVGVLGIIWWRMNRSDIRFKREVLDKKVLGDQPVDLRNLGP